MATKLSLDSKYLPVKHTFIHFDPTFESDTDSACESPEPRRRMLSVPSTVPRCFRPASPDLTPTTTHEMEPTFEDHHHSAEPLFPDYAYSPRRLHHSSDAQLFHENDVYRYSHTQDAFAYGQNGMHIQHNMEYSYMYSQMEHASSQKAPLEGNADGFQVYEDDTSADHNGERDAAATDTLSGDLVNQGAGTPQKNVTKTIKLSEFLPEPGSPGGMALDINNNISNAMQHWLKKQYSEENVMPSNVSHGGQRENSGRKYHEKQQNDQWEHRISRRTSRRHSRRESCDFREYRGSTTHYHQDSHGPSHEYHEHREGQREHQEAHREYHEPRDGLRERRNGGHREQRDAYQEHRKGQREVMHGRENREDREGREMKRERHRRSR